MFAIVVKGFTNRLKVLAVSCPGCIRRTGKPNSTSLRPFMHPQNRVTDCQIDRHFRTLGSVYYGIKLIYSIAIPLKIRQYLWQAAALGAVACAKAHAYGPYCLAHCIGRLLPHLVQLTTCIVLCLQ